MFPQTDDSTDVKTPRISPRVWLVVGFAVACIAAAVFLGQETASFIRDAAGGFVDLIER